MSGATTAGWIDNVTEDVERLIDLKTTCTVCLSLSLGLLAPVVITSLLANERSDFPSRVTTGFLTSVILMSVTVLLGAIIDYRIPNPENRIISMFTGATLMDDNACRAQAIWCVCSSCWIAGSVVS
jgi:hypothetical protein